MSFLHRNSLAKAACAALLVCFAFALAQSCLPHTDDGCAVEFHCFACRWTIANTAVIAAPPVLAPRIDTVGEPVASEDHAAPDVSVPASSSRGPPRA